MTKSVYLVQSDFIYADDTTSHHDHFARETMWQGKASAQQLADNLVGSTFQLQWSDSGNMLSTAVFRRGEDFVKFSVTRIEVRP